MRIGVYLPTTGENGEPLDGAGIAAQAKVIEDAGIDGIWMGDHLPVPGSGRVGPDPLLFLTIAALGTDSIELGTGIYNLGLRMPIDVAQRLNAMQTVAPGRFTIGVGTGSQEREYEASGVAWEGRFAHLHENMDGVRSILDGRPSQPRFLLGTWGSEPQLKRASTQFQGWLASASANRGGGWQTVLTTAIKRYRELGGKRAIVSTISMDLTQEAAPFGNDTPFNLFCPPAVAHERLEYLESLGFDDVILMSVDRSGESDGSGRSRRFATREDYELIRSLMPKDGRDYHDV